MDVSTEEVNGKSKLAAATANASSVKVKKPIEIALRIIIIGLLICMFIPAFNPTHLSALSDKNASLFTTGISYGSLSEGFSRALKKGWIEQSVITMTYIGALITCLGLVTSGIGCAVTLGELRLKRIGGRLGIIGCVVGAVGTGLILAQYPGYAASKKPDKIGAVIPSGIYVFFAVTALCLIIGIIYLVTLPKVTEKDKYEMAPKYKLFLMFLPFIVLLFLFSYLPLWGWRYAFYDYTPGAELTSENFVGFKWFAYLFENSATRSDIIRVLTNTLAMSGLGLLTSWMPLAFAIFLAEIKNSRFRRIVQTVTTIPNFISWVLIYTFAFALFSTEGFVNQFLIDAGAYTEPINFLMGEKGIWFKMLLWGLWKSLGWNAIIYIAAITGIDQQLYEAATIDGAGRFAKIWHITIPELMPTFFVLLLLAIAGILSNGMDQYLVFKNATNKNTIEVLDLYVYNLGLGGSGGMSQIPLSTVVGMVKSLVSVILLFAANRVSKAIRGESIV